MHLEPKYPHNLGSEPKVEVLMDLESESENDEGAGVTPGLKKRGTSIFQVAIKDVQLWVVKCGT